MHSSITDHSLYVAVSVGLSDPFVELSLLPEWLFPESAREFFKTTVHKQTVDPVFNEEFRM